MQTVTMNNAYTIVTDSSFNEEVLESTGPVMVDLWADWCGPCHIIAPVIEELAREYQGRVKVGKLDIDANPETATKYGIRSIPAVLFLKNGEIVDQVIGAVPKKELVDKLDSLL
jgi:thioredoxin 1